MTDNRTTELLFCPFCGGEALIIHFTQDACYVKCENHDCMAGQKVYGTKAEAIAAWNARAERTCRPEEEYLDNYSDLTVTVCSNCRVAIDDLEDCCYCPNCGARVIGTEAGE